MGAGEHGPAGHSVALPAIIRFGVAAVRHAADGFTKVDPETLAARLLACARCEHLKDGRVCGACGCYVQTKAGWRSEDCPLGKWELPTVAPEKALEGGCGCGGAAQK